MNRGKEWRRWLVGSAAAFMVCSCSVKLRTGYLTQPIGSYQNQIVVADRAEKMHTVIGLVHFSLLYLPIAPVKTVGKGEEELMKVIRQTVEHMGYKVYSPAQAGQCDGCPVLSVTVSKFSFHDYTWMFPMVITWGKIALEVSVQDSSGKSLWSKTYQAKARDNSEMDYEPVVNKALNTILNQMIRDIATPQFQQAVWGRDAEAPGT